jgi:hypothetical protein
VKFTKRMRNLVRGDETGRQIIVTIIVTIASGTKTYSYIKLLGGDERDVKFY